MNQQRMLAHRVVLTLWPNMPPYDKENLTLGIAKYVFIVYLRARQANALVQSLLPVLNLSTVSGWETLPKTLIDAVASGINASWDERGLAVRSLIAHHERIVREALTYGLPLELAGAAKSA